MEILHSVLLLACGLQALLYTAALNNGLALTPPMGWLSWTRFMCQVDCKKYPKDCISQNLFAEMADIMVKEGYRDAGYVHVNIDDCWMSRKRNAAGFLEPDPERFSSGIKWLAEYMHNRGLKLGIYENYGKTTCMGFPGSRDHMQLDANTFASWDVDMFKFDGCFNDPTKLDAVYPEMGRYLNETGRKMVYSCSWPFYIRTELKQRPNYKSVVEHCNLWRNFDDIQMHWKSIENIIRFYDNNQDELSQFHGPGHWNDPDMIIVGNPGLTLDQCRAQMAIWAIWSAPLLMSNDLRNIKPEFKQVLLNSKVISVNQDPLGIMGKRIGTLANAKVSVYQKRLSAKDDKSGTPYAMAFLNLDEYQMIRIEFKLEKFELHYEKGYLIDDLFSVETNSGDKAALDADDGSPIDTFLSVDKQETIELHVPPTGVVMWRLEPDDGDPTIYRRKLNGEQIRPGLNHQLYFGVKRRILGLRLPWTYTWIYLFITLVLLYVCFKKCLVRYRFKRLLYRRL